MTRLKEFDRFLCILKVFLVYITPIWFGVICCMIISYQAYLQEDKNLVCIGGVVTALIIFIVHMCIKSVIEWAEAKNTLIKNIDY